MNSCAETGDFGRPPSAWRQLLVDTRGQDLIEYALLTATVGLAAVVLFTIVAPGGPLNRAYAAWDGAQQGLWEVPDPQP